MTTGTRTKPDFYAILGDGWTSAGFSATDILPTSQGVAYLIAEGGVPRRVKVAYLSDGGFTPLADYAAWTRKTPPTPIPAPAPAIPAAAHVA